MHGCLLGMAAAYEAPADLLSARNPLLPKWGACAQEVLKSYKPRASVVPAELDLSACPFMWPFCKQPLYAHAMPTMFNATVLNGMGLTGEAW